MSFEKIKYRQIGPSILILLLVCHMTGCSTSFHPVYDKTIQEIHEQLEAKDITEENRISNLSAENAVKQGRAYLRKGNLNLARIFFIQALNKDSSCLAAMLGLGDIIVAEGKVPEALDVFETINRKHPKNNKVLCKLASIYRLIGKHEVAIDYANQAILIAPQSPETLMELALTYDTTGNHELAEPLYRSIVNIFPASANAYNNLGCNLILQKRFKEAISALRDASSFSPDDIKIKNNLAMAYAMNNYNDSAFNILKKNLGEAEALNNLGYIYMTQGKWKDAESCLKRAIEVKPVYYVKASENLERLKKLIMSE